MIFQEESYQNCFQKAVELLILINPENPFPNFTAKKSLGFELEDFWKKLVNHVEHSKSSTKIEAALPLLGSLLFQVFIYQKKKFYIFITVIIIIYFNQTTDL